MWASALLVVALVTGASANFEPPPPPPQLPAYVRFNAGECSAATEAPIDFTTLAAASFGETTECSAATDTCAFKVTIASDFDIEYYPNYKIVRNYFSNTTHVLHQCGTEQPSALLFQGQGDVRYFEVPLTAIAVEDSTAAYFLEALGVSDRVRYGPGFSASPCMELIASAESAGGCGRVAGDGIAEASIDAYVSSPPFSTGPAAFASRRVVFSAVNDPGALNRAEWIAYLAPFFNREGTASAFYAGVKARYEAASTPVTATSPTVAWLDFNTYISGTDGAGNAVSGSGLVVHFAAYKVQLTTDAGGQMVDRAAWAAAADKTFVASSDDQVIFPFDLYASATSSGARNVMRRIKTLLEGVDIVIDESYIAPPQPADLTADFVSNLEITEAEAATMPFLVNNAHWKHDKLQYSGDAWFGEAVARPDIVLEDMKVMFAPAGATPVGATTYFRNVATGDEQVVAPETCTEITCASYAAQAPLLIADDVPVAALVVPGAVPAPGAAPAAAAAVTPEATPASGAAGFGFARLLLVGAAAVAAALL